jgi:hypothetical protein
MIKPTIYILLFGVIISTTRAQSVQDYFITDSPNNRANFSVPGSSLLRSLYYLKNDSGYTVKDSSFMQKSLYSTDLKVVKFTTDEVQLVRIETQFSSMKRNADFNPVQVLLKMPAKGQTSSWTLSILNDKNVQCTSSWTTIQYNGEQRSAIKVEKVREGISAKEIEYYVKGIGFWKAEVLGGGSTIIKAQMDKLTLDPNIK